MGLASPNAKLPQVALEGDYSKPGRNQAGGSLSSKQFPAADSMK
jgi:hypothetical protein